MHYSLGLATTRVWPAISIVGALGQETARQDSCTQDLIDRLQLLAARKRRAVRIVDINCGDGALLIHAAREARSLGFLSIECLGVDEDQRLVEEARDRAHFVTDTAIGLDFAVATPIDQLQREAEFPADIILYAARSVTSPATTAALQRAGDVAFQRDMPTTEYHA